MKTNLRTRLCFKNANDGEFSLSNNFIPMLGEVIIISENNNSTLFKVGDGKTELQNLPFMTTRKIGDNDSNDFVLKDEYSVKFSTQTFAFTLSANAWTKTTPSVQIVSVPGMEEETKITLIWQNNKLEKRQQEKQEWNFIDYIKVEKDKIKFYCSVNTPTIDLKGYG